MLSFEVDIVCEKKENNTIREFNISRISRVITYIFLQHMRDDLTAVKSENGIYMLVLCLDKAPIKHDCFKVSRFKILDLIGFLRFLQS